MILGINQRCVLTCFFVDLRSNNALAFAAMGGRFELFMGGLFFDYCPDPGAVVQNMICWMFLRS